MTKLTDRLRGKYGVGAENTADAFVRQFPPDFIAPIQIEAADYIDQLEGIILEIASTAEDFLEKLADLSGSIAITKDNAVTLEVVGGNIVAYAQPFDWCARVSALRQPALAALDGIKAMKPNED